MSRLLAALFLVLACAGAQAQPYPSKPIRLVVPFPPGGSIDIMARRLAIPLTAKLGQSVVVENRAGAGSIVGGTFVAQAPNDGYTLLFASSSTLTLAPAITTKLPYDPVKDFTPVSLVGDLPFLLLVHPSVPANSVQELIALAKSRGAGVLNYSSFGNATTNHFFGEMLNSMGGVKITHVPYKGGAPALTALIAGEVQIMFDSTPASMPRVQAGAVKALGITSAKRVSSYPQIPTIAEQGLPELVGGAWFGVLGPGGMSELIGSTPREFADFVRRETARWTKIARDNNIRAE